MLGFLKNLGILLISSVVLAGCMTYDPLPYYQKTAQFAETHGFTAQYLSVGQYELLTYTRLSRLNGDLTIYLEGDGAAWHSRRRLSSDPTPKKTLVLELADSDFAENVAYLARPCQYVLQVGRGRNCEPKVWSTDRFSTEVVAAMGEAVDRLKKQALAERLHLVGYSGGGAVAVLLAAQRNDVVSLRTVAGNLDPLLFSQHHRLSPLAGSLNPAEVASLIEDIPQIHFSGKQDRIVPCAIAESYRARQSQTACSELVDVPGAGHSKGWLSVWSALLAQPLPCADSVNRMELR